MNSNPVKNKIVKPAFYLLTALALGATSFPTEANAGLMGRLFGGGQTASRPEAAPARQETRRVEEAARASRPHTEQQQLSIAEARKARIKREKTDFSLSKQKYDFTTNEMYRNLKLKANEVERLNSALNNAGLATRGSEGELLVTTVENIVREIQKGKDLASNTVSRAERQKMADLMGDIGHSIFWQVLKNRPSNASNPSIGYEARNILSIFVEAVSHFEKYQVHEYVKDTKDSEGKWQMAFFRPHSRTGKPLDFFAVQELDAPIVTFRRGNREPLDVINIITGEKTGKRFNFEADVSTENAAGLLSSGELWEGAMANEFIIAMKGHDIFHSWYLYGHPWAANAYYRSARSINHKKFAVMGAYFESVDRVQYGFESTLIRYLDQKLKINREDAYIYIAMLSEKQMDKLIVDANIGSDGTYTRILEDLRGKSPRYNLETERKIHPDFNVEITVDGQKKWLTADEALSLAIADTYHRLVTKEDPIFNQYAPFDRDVAVGQPVTVDALRPKSGGDGHVINTDRAHDYSQTINVDAPADR